MKSIQINFAFPKSSELQTQMEQAVKQMQKYSTLDIALDTKSFSKSLNEMSKMLSNLKTQLGKFNILENVGVDSAYINGSVKSVNALAEAMGRLNEKSQLRAKSDTSKWQVTQANAVNKGIDANKKYEQSIDDLKVKMNNLVNSSNSNKSFTFVDGNVFDDLKRKINSITTDTPVSEIRELENVIKNLGSNDSQIVRLQNSISKYGITIEGLKGKYKNIVPDKELTEAMSKIESLKSMLNTLQSGGTISRQGLTNVLNQASSSMKSLETATKNASEQQRLYNKEVVTFGGAFKDIATKTGLFTIAYSAMNGIQNQFRDGVRSVVEMDGALADLNKVVDLSKIQLDQMRDSAVSMGEELGRSATDVAKAQAEFGRMYKDLGTINELTKVSIIGANTMGDLNTDQVAKGLTTIMSSLKLEAKDAMSILDSLNEVQNNYKVSSSSMLEALGEIGSTAKVSGASLQQLEGYITAISVATGAAGSEVGNSLKSIMSKVYKLGSEGLDSEEAAKPEKALKAVGVAIRDAEGNFRKIDDILKDLDGSWKNMTDSQKIATAQAVAGIHQYDKFIALMNNFDMATSSTATAMNSMGSATKENEIYLQSIEGRLSSLKATTQGFWLDFIDSDAIKGGITALESFIKLLNGIQQTFGTLGASVGVLSGAFLMFTNNPISKVLNEISLGVVTSSKGLKGFGSEFKATFDQIKASGTSTNSAVIGLQAFTQSLKTGRLAEIALKLETIALQSVLSMGLSLAISAVIGGLSKLIDASVTTSSELKEMNDASMNTFEANGKLISSVEDLIAKENTLKDKLKESGLTYEEQNTYKSELVGIQKQLAEILPESASGFDSEGNKISTNTEKVLENLDAKKKLSEQEAIKAINKNDDFDTLIKAPKEYQGVKKQLEDMQLAYKNNEDYMGKEVTSKWIDKIQKKVDEYEEAIKITSSSIEALRTAGWSEERIAQELFKDMPMKDALDWYNKLLPVVDEYSNSLDENTQNINENKDALDGLSNTEIPTPEIKEVDISEITKSYTDALSTISDLQKATENLNEVQAITPDIMSDLISKYPDITKLGTGITDLATVQDYLNGKIAETESIAMQAYDNMIDADTNYYNTKIKNNNEANSIFQQAIAQLNKVQGTAYNADLSNFASLQAMKESLTNTFGEAVGSYVTELVQAYANGYDIDYSNALDWARQKSALLKQLDSQIARLSRNMSNSLTTIQNATKNGKAFGAAEGEAEKLYMMASNALATTTQYRAEILEEINGATLNLRNYNATVGGYKGNYSTGSVGSGSGSGSGGSGGSGSGSATTEKEINDIEDLTERYYELNNVVKIYDNLISKNKQAQENASISEKNILMKQEIELYQKKKDALRQLYLEQLKERDAMQKELQANGFGIDANGNVSNRNEEFARKVAKANNSLSGGEKETYINYIEDMEELIKKYDDLNSTITQTTDDYNDLTNAIKDAQKSMLEDTRNKLVDALRKQREEEKDGKIAEYDARIEELQQQIRDLEDEEDDKLKKKAKLEAQLEAWKKDDSVYSKSQQHALQKELDALNKDLAKAEIEKQIDSLEGEKEQVSTNYDDMLSDKALYLEADRLLTENKQEEMLLLLNTYSESYKETGALLGQNFSQAFQSELENAKNALDGLLKSTNDSMAMMGSSKPNVPSSPTTTSTSNLNTNSTPKPTQTTPVATTKPVGGIGSKAKVVDSSATMYTDSYTSSGVGNWSSFTNQPLYIVNESNGKVALGSSSSISSAIGWIDKKFLQGFKDGGLLGSWGNGDGKLFVGHTDEAVLTAEQTKGWLKLVDMLPNLINNPMLQIGNLFKYLPTNANGGEVVINNEFNVQTANEFDAQRFEENFEKQMLRDISRFGKKLRTT